MAVADAAGGVAGVHRVSVVGSSGAGESTFGRELADRTGAPFVELDAVHHLADWTPIDPDEFVGQATELAAGDRSQMERFLGTV